RGIRDIAINASGHEIATASNDNTARIWQVNQYPGNRREGTRISHKDKVSSVDFNPDGKFLATASEDGTAGVWQVNAEQRFAHVVYGGTEGSVVTVSPSGRFVAVGGAGSIQVREAADGREVGRVVYADNSESKVEVAQVSLSQDSGYLWMSRQSHGRGGRGPLPDVQNIARVWDASRGEEVARIKYEDTPGTAVFGPDGKHLAADERTTLHVWDVTRGLEVARVKHEPASATPVFSADGSYLAIVEPKAIRIL